MKNFPKYNTVIGRLPCGVVGLPTPPHAVLSPEPGLCREVEGLVRAVPGLADEGRRLLAVNGRLP